MNRKTTIVVIAIIVIVGAGAVGYFLANQNNTDDNDNTQASTSQQADKAGTGEEKATINSLLNKGSNQKCEFSSVANETTAAGTIYFSNKRMRGEYTTTTKDQTSKGNMLIVGNTQYYWTESSQKGVKMDISGQQNQNNQSGEGQQPTNGGLDTKQGYKFTCNDWKVDESKFTPPADIEFTDLTKIQSQISNGL